MEFRRIENLPPYVFTIINNLKIEARRAGHDVVDLGFGNPDIPSPDSEKMSPPLASIAAWRMSSCRAKACRMPSMCCSHLAELPWMSVNRNVTAPS